MNNEYINQLCQSCFSKIETSGAFCPVCGYSQGTYPNYVQLSLGYLAF